MIIFTKRLSTQEVGSTITLVFEKSHK